MAMDNTVFRLRKKVLAVRIIQLILTVLVLALVAYATSELGYTGMVDAYGVNLFTCCATFIVITYSIVSSVAVHSLYNMWAVLALEIFLIIMWLVSFALLASRSANFYFSTGSSWDYCYSCWWKRDLGPDALEKRAAPSSTPWVCGAAASGLGGLLFLTFILTLAIHSLDLWRHRRGGATRAAPHAAGTEEAKVEQTVPIPPQQPVPQYVQEQPVQYPAQHNYQQPVPQQGYPTTYQTPDQTAYQQPPSQGYSSPSPVTAGYSSPSPGPQTYDTTPEVNAPPPAHQQPQH
ncbi:MAG: hypothetical protein M1837_001394 [Sclerophora amabilis]|nr:MAG: hypothetical protein M1837_001394 [Sclerophora amabilis]